MAGKKKELLKHLTRDVYCRLGVSTVHGVGVFAVRAIPKGVNPLKTLSSVKEVKLKRSDLGDLPKGVRKQLKMFCYYEGDTIYVPESGLNLVNMAVYVNHSKTPNLYFKKDGDLRALVDIEEGAELLIDYDLSFGETHKFKSAVQPAQSSQSQERGTNHVHGVHSPE